MNFTTANDGRPVTAGVAGNDGLYCGNIGEGNMMFGSGDLYGLGA